MTPTASPVMSKLLDVAEQAACAEPAALRLVDAAFERSGGDEAAQLRELYCTRCPIATACLAQAMQHGEYGAWAGTSQYLRTRHGAARPIISRTAA